MWVVKIGGSLFRTRALREWLDVIATRGPGRVVVVPGGGPFADQVRRAQNLWGFSDDIAHSMALKAMEQFGWMMIGLNAALCPAESDDELVAGLRDGRVPVWMPSAMASRETAIQKDWDFTSDSLAAWLASRLRAEHLVLVKSVSIQGDTLTADELSRRGVVDAVFPSVLGNGCWTAWLCARHHHRKFPRALAVNQPVGARLLSDAAGGTTRVVAAGAA